MGVSAVCPMCGKVVPLMEDGRFVTHNTEFTYNGRVRPKRCPGGLRYPHGAVQ